MKLYQLLIQHYPVLEPHAETWALWLKPNKRPSELFEVAIGAILVQNTNWRNVNHAVANLKRAGITSFDQVQQMDPERLKALIKPAGFLTQKARSLHALSKLLLTQQAHGIPPSRHQLLACRGIGLETADSILAFCFHRPVAVVGTYTRRLFARLRGDVTYLTTPYEALQHELHQDLPQDPEILGRFHALIVCHGQNRCQKTAPKCVDCVLQANCMYGLHYETDPTIAHIQTVISPPKRKPAGN
ncbi:MAG: endonuclease III domain-containing protein [Candidatus Heimdallarchaeota archaeon]